ncbi:putative RWD, RING finger and WD repeat-containing protein C11E3.05 [Grifola frondosa]|uniref:Putative RWD, RING finger and WD repeat-containing protein C11E3.05 n=1 Tax=Grifola frondosa TaxID=5627 RepID=A0A1C7MM71_GRIFR|nr:putative RWD, RING finger and WD repeat-containing protein C11E3.05 [Grifola frondosa]
MPTSDNYVPSESNIRLSLQIDMKGLIGEAIGNMSISPTSRDVVLAARKGLFIIDLENPFNVPRFLPQGGTWDVADVQWNPHRSHDQYIVSTSSEKLLIWNITMIGKTSIEYVLRAHYRAITDINWHTTDPDVVVSTGIDAWLWAWDLRTPRKPIMGLCAFNSGGTQVKWNRQDGNLLASSHSNEVLIWDRRKGSMPLSRIKAHSAKIYGIDWAQDRRDELVTCSLDKTIKVWNTQTSESTITIHTGYPVWRARDLPFGQGVLSLPQRGATALEMYSYDNPLEPIEIFEGHADVVKEFVWRRGGQDGAEFQLITWSKDKTLRFWPVNSEVVQRAGTTPTLTSTISSYRREPKASFSTPPLGSEFPPALSAPVGHRSILAEVRAPPPSMYNTRRGAVPDSEVTEKQTTGSASKPIPFRIRASIGDAAMTSRTLKRSTQITTLDWISSVKVGMKREGSSGPASGGESGNASRFNSRSRPPSVKDRSASQALSTTARGNNSRDRVEDGPREDDSGQILQDEITSVMNKLASSKIKLEKADLTKKRTCTFGLQGPWGESTSVFIRITFTFPRGYPQANDPSGIATIDLERSPLISIKQHAFILRRLRTIREQQRRCLEGCLRFLLFGDQNDDPRRTANDFDSSSEDELPFDSRKAKSGGLSTMRGDKNLAEPRTSQGVFGANGQLVCFSRAPPRIVRNPLREISVSPSIASRAPDARTHLLNSPALLSEAVHDLAVAAQDRDVQQLESKTEDANILRIMANLFTFLQQKPRRVSEHSRPLEDIPASYLLPTRRSTVFIKDVSSLENARLARMLGRTHHERIFKMLQTLFVHSEASHEPVELLCGIQPNVGAIAAEVTSKLYQELLATKDAHMLSFLSVLLLQTSPLRGELRRPVISTISATTAVSRKLPTLDRQHLIRLHLLLRLHRHHEDHGRVLFNANSMRQFVSGSKATSSIPAPGGVKIRRGLSATRRGGLKRDSSQNPTSPTARSWSEAAETPAILSTVTFTSDGHIRRRPTFSQVLSTRPADAEKRRIIFHPPKAIAADSATLHPQLRSQLICHILTFSDMLLAWQLPERRSELLKLVEEDIRATTPDPDSSLYSGRLGCLRICERCGLPNEPGITICGSCGGQALARCTICRLPVKGLSRGCPSCLHITHAMCLKARRDPLCASGCGCQCAQVWLEEANRRASFSSSPLAYGQYT